MRVCCNYINLHSSQKSIKKDIKSLFARYSKLRARQLDIYLECLEPYMCVEEKTQLTVSKNLSSICKSFSYLNNYDDYACKFQLYCAERRQLRFAISF